MDNDNKEFETFLRQFHLRQHAGFPEEAPVKVANRRRGHRWIFAIAAALVVAVLSLPVVRHFSQSGSQSAIVEMAGDSSYKNGERIGAGKTIRSGATETLLIGLEDGTRLEMRAQSELVLESAEDGTRVRLNNGSILVSAAKQRRGHLYVEAADMSASVVGTAFLVEAQPMGARVSVLEGEVEVRHKLKTGQQASTDPSMETRSLAEAIAWSRRAGEFGSMPASTTPEPVPALRRRVSAQSPAPQEEPRPQQPQPEQPQPPASQEKQPEPDAGADGPGKAIFNRACLGCHSEVAMKSLQFLTREAIANRVSLESSRGAMVSQSEFSVLVDYLFRTYGNNGRKN